jgi:hypothetical protein
LLALISIFANESGVTKWGAIASIVAAVAAVLLIVAGCVRWAWRRRRAPRVEVSGGNTDLFRRKSKPEERHNRFPSDSSAPYYVHTTRLMVRETNNAEARIVHLRIIKVDPGPDEKESLPIGLQWVNGADDLNLSPGAKAFIRLCEAVEGIYGERLGVLTSVPGLAPGKSVWFSVEAVVDGRRLQPQASLQTGKTSHLSTRK